MNVVPNYAECFMETAANYRLKSKHDSVFKKLKASIIILLDNIFAALSSSYQNQRTLVIQQVIVKSANQDDEEPDLDKAHHLFLQKIGNSPLLKDESEDVAIEDEVEEDSSISDGFSAILMAEKDEVKETINGFVVQGLQDDEIIDIMKDVITQDCCRELIIQIKKSLKGQIPTPVKKVERTKSRFAYPAFIFAADGMNQYQAGGPAACTPLACQFLASKEAASAQMLAKLLLANHYKNVEFIDTEEGINQFQLNIAENPWEAQKDFSSSMQVNFESGGKIGITAAVTSLLNSQDINGAIFTANGVTIAMRKRDHAIEFFDSHGDNTLTNQGNTAYIYTFSSDQIKQMVDFLVHRFPNIGFTPSIEIWPIE